MAGNAEIDLPASPYRLLNALDEIGIKSTKEIVYQEILNYGSFGYLEPHFDEYTMLEELNTLAQKLAVFDRVDSIAFEGYDEETAMKPYIEKNDGVPDNNRYSEALEAAKETVEALNKLTDQALAQYTALVDSAVAGHITDERELEHIMDGLLDFGDDLRFLEIYKRLCRHIFYKHPQMVGEHIYLWRMQFDTKDEEDENE